LANSASEYAVRQRFGVLDEPVKDLRLALARQRGRLDDDAAVGRVGAPAGGACPLEPAPSLAPLARRPPRAGGRGALRQPTLAATEEAGQLALVRAVLRRDQQGKAVGVHLTRPPLQVDLRGRFVDAAVEGYVEDIEVIGRTRDGRDIALRGRAGGCNL